MYPFMIFIHAHAWCIHLHMHIAYAVCCSVLQCVAMCCNVLQCAALCLRLHMHIVYTSKNQICILIYMHTMYTHITTHPRQTTVGGKKKRRKSEMVVTWAAQVYQLNLSLCRSRDPRSDQWCNRKFCFGSPSFPLSKLFTIQRKSFKSSWGILRKSCLWGIWFTVLFGLARSDSVFSDYSSFNFPLRVLSSICTPNH